MIDTFIGFVEDRKEVPQYESVLEGTWQDGEFVPDEDE